jgi:ankyrin repeat protein
VLPYGSHADAQGDNNRTALHKASFGGKTEAVELLVKAKATIDSRDSVRDAMSCLTGLSCCSATCGTGGITYSTVLQTNATPLHLGVRREKASIVEMLVNAKADVHAEDSVMMNTPTDSCLSELWML